jgi:hypothetical protein
MDETGYLCDDEDQAEIIHSKIKYNKPGIVVIIWNKLMILKMQNVID